MIFSGCIHHRGPNNSSLGFIFRWTEYFLMISNMNWTQFIKYLLLCCFVVDQLMNIIQCTLSLQHNIRLLGEHFDTISLRWWCSWLTRRQFYFTNARYKRVFFSCIHRTEVNGNSTLRICISDVRFILTVWTYRAMTILINYLHQPGLPSALGSTVSLFDCIQCEWLVAPDFTVLIDSLRPIAWI